MHSKMRPVWGTKSGAALPLKVEISILVKRAKGRCLVENLFTMKNRPHPIVRPVQLAMGSGSTMYRCAAIITALSMAVAFATTAKTGTPARVPLPPSNPLKNTEKEKQDNSKPALALFSEKKLPSLGKAMAIGYYPGGCLQGGVELPITGSAWQVMRVSRNRNWGHPELVQLLGTVRAAGRGSYWLERNTDRGYGAAARRSASVRT